jgi:hypothetical protein
VESQSLIVYHQSQMPEARHLARRRQAKPKENGLPRFAILDSNSLLVSLGPLNNQSGSSHKIPHTQRFFWCQNQTGDVLLERRRVNNVYNL